MTTFVLGFIFQKLVRHLAILTISLYSRWVGTSASSKFTFKENGMEILNCLMQSSFLVGFQKRLRYSCEAEAMKTFGTWWELRFDLWAYTRKWYKPSSKQTKDSGSICCSLGGGGKASAGTIICGFGKRGLIHKNADLNISYSDAVNSQLCLMRNFSTGLVAHDNQFKPLDL